MADRLYWQDPQTVQLLCTALSQGSLIAGSSDTVIGLLAQPTIEGAALLDSVKGRQSKPYILLIESMEQAKSYVDPGSLLQIEKLAAICWPGPVTLIVKARSDVQFIGILPNFNIAIRIPDQGPLRKLAGLMGGLFSTSANLTGGLCQKP